MTQIEIDMARSVICGMRELEAIPNLLERLVKVENEKNEILTEILKAVSEKEQ